MTGPPVCVFAERWWWWWHALMPLLELAREAQKSRDEMMAAQRDTRRRRTRYRARKTHVTQRTAVQVMILPSWVHDNESGADGGLVIDRAR
jgi:hypothetical protein